METIQFVKQLFGQKLGHLLCQVKSAVLEQKSSESINPNGGNQIQTKIELISHVHEKIAMRQSAQRVGNDVA